jgi:predicted nuclease of predicted toxin-antitoxin system
MDTLADHNLEGQAVLLWGTLEDIGWLKLLPIKLLKFSDVGLPDESTDQEVWRFVQKHDLILLTGNRKMKGKDSLEQTIREENTPSSLPVLTVGKVEQLEERLYRERCANRLVEIMVDLDNYRGVGRIFIP